MTENNALIVAEKLDVSVVFTADGLQGILQDIESQAMAHVPDIESDQGRKDIASMAYKVTRSKTLIDNLGKDVVADWKKKAKVIDGHRKTARDFLDELKDKVRQPLTDWEAEQEKIKAEEAERERKAIEKRIQDLAKYRVILPYQEVALMTDEEFDSVLAKEKEAWEAEQKQQAEAEALRKAEEERLEKQRQEQDAEAARLKKQADEIAAQQKAIQDEKNRIEAEKRAEQERKDREEFERKAKEEAKIQAEKDAKDKAAQEAKEAKEREIEAAEEAKRAEALLPDKEKLAKWIRGYKTNPIPNLASEEVGEILLAGVERIQETLDWMLRQIDNL